MDQRGYDKVLDVVGDVNEVYPAITDERTEARFVTIESHPADEARDINWTLNALTAAGLMEGHGDTDFSYGSDPQFRVVAISGKTIHLEDTNSRLY